MSNRSATSAKYASSNQLTNIHQNSDSTKSLSKKFISLNIQKGSNRKTIRTQEYKAKLLKHQS